MSKQPGRFSPYGTRPNRYAINVLADALEIGCRANFDLIFGLPGETEKEAQMTLE